MISKLSYETVRVIITSFPYPVRKKEKDLDLSNVDQVVLESINSLRSACQYLSPELEKKISGLQIPTQSLLQMLMLNTKQPSTDEAKPSTIKDHPTMPMNTTAVDSSPRRRVTGGKLYDGSIVTKPWMNKSGNIR